MRRKYLYFKIFDLTEHPQEVLAFSQIEIEQIVGPVTAIDNIFQLSQQPEIKRIIEKDVDLQNALTDSLPRRGRHGYLWIGEELPNIFHAISSLAYIREIYLFQQMLEPEPSFIKDNLRHMPYHEMNIYLWRVYRFWTVGFLMGRALYIATISKHESDIDEKFKQLQAELLQAPGKLADKDPANMIAYNPEQPGIHWGLDRRTPANRDLRWYQALSNFSANDTAPALFLPFCNESALVQQALLAGHNVRTADGSALDMLFTRANTALLSVPAETFNKLSVEIHSKTKLIINMREHTQADLFMYSIEGQFLSFWNDEKKRLERIGPTAFDIIFLKHIAATRFLIESQTLTRNDNVNTLFSSALAITLIKALNRKKQAAFYEAFAFSLREIYIHLYLLQKIKAFIDPEFGKLIPDSDTADPAIDGSVVFLPEHFEPVVPPKDQSLNDILNYPPPPSVGLHRNNAENLAQIHQVEEDIREKKGFYTKLPKIARDLLTRLELYGQKIRVTEFYRLLAHYHDILELLNQKLPVAARVALIIPPMEIKIETQTQDIDLVGILKGFLDDKQGISFKLLQQISKHVHPLKSNFNKVYKVLLLQKI